jgi:hypothetical protein
MSNDFWVNTILIIFILLHILVLITVLIFHKFLWYVSVLNAISGLIVIIYWVQNQLRITQHIYETGEMAFLGFEMVVVAVSIYSILSSHAGYWLKFTQYLFFSIHFICLVLLLLFMLFFKMDKLI